MGSARAYYLLGCIYRGDKNHEDSIVQDLDKSSQYFQKANELGYNTPKFSTNKEWNLYLAKQIYDKYQNTAELVNYNEWVAIQKTK